MTVALTDHFDPEEPVIEAIRQGDKYAFSELVRRQNRFVRGVVLGVLGSTDRVDDVTQQVWAAVWERAEKLRDVKRWRSWLYRLARNAAIDAGRDVTRRRNRDTLVTEHVRATGVPADKTPAASLIGDEEHRTVLAAIEGLPALYREPFVLRHMNGWSYQQIADVMDMPVDSVETRLVRARRLLRSALKNKLAES
jgi:RNA polymerase sigma-70 factor (ECF subfamily)